MIGIVAWLAVACTGISVVLAAAPRWPRPPGRVRRLGSSTVSSGPAATGLARTRRARTRPARTWRVWCTWLGRQVLARRFHRGAPTRPGSDPDRPEQGAEARLGAALTVGLAGLMISPVLVIPMAAVAWAWPGWRARGRRRRWQRDLVQVAPDLVEMFRLSAGAGLSVHQAVHALASRATGPAGAALAEVVATQARGAPLADGLDAVGAWGEAVRPLASALAATQRYGVALGPALDRASVEAREVRRRQAEESARRLPVLMLFPLVVCILPAAGLLTVVPLLVASWPQLPR